MRWRGTRSKKIRPERMRPSVWWARQDSNLQPDRYERQKLAAFPSEVPEIKENLGTTNFSNAEANVFRRQRRAERLCLGWQAVSWRS